MGEMMARKVESAREKANNVLSKFNNFTFFLASFWLHLVDYAILCTLPLVLSSLHAPVIRAVGPPFFPSVFLHAGNWHLYGGLFELVLSSA